MSTNRQPKTPIRPEEIKKAELYGVITQALGEPEALEDSVIVQKLIAAEDFYERDLDIRLQPTRVFSDPHLRTNHEDPALRINDYDPLNDLADPAYDYEAGLWENHRWAMFKLRYLPITSVDHIVFTWAGSRRIWEVPQDWIKWDSMAGTAQIVPTSGPAVLMTFGAYVLSVLAGGHGLPHSAFIDYRTGYGNDLLCHHHNELLEGIRLRTALSLIAILSTAAIPGGQTGGSLSLDGLSESRQFGGKFGPYTGKILLAQEQEQEIRRNWKRREKGIAVAFV